MTGSPADAPPVRRLRTHLLGLAFALLLPSLGLGAAVAWRAVQAYRDAFETRLEDTARALAFAVDRQIATLTATLEGLAASPMLDEEATPAQLEAFRERARAISEPLGTWVVVRGPGPDFPTHVHTLSPTGAPLQEGARLPDPDAPLPRVFATGRAAIGGVARGRVTGRPTAFVFVPVLRGGRVVRAVGMAVDPARLAQLLAAQGFSGDAYTVVVDSRGQVAARSREHDRFVGQPAVAWYVAAAARAPAGFLRGPGPDGAEIVLGYAHLTAAPGWSVALVEPWSAYAQAWQRPLQALAIGGVLVLVLGLAAAAWLAGSLVRPVRALAADAASVAAAGRGADLPAPSAVPSGIAEFDALRRDIAAAAAALRARAEEARASEERVRLAVEGTGMATWDLDLQTGRIVWSRHHFRMLGLDADIPQQATVARWRARVHPDDLPELDTAWARAEREGGLFHALYRIRRADDGGLRWMESYGRVIRAKAGGPRFVGVMFDVTERHATEERQRLLMREVDHRAKNLLAVVQSVIRLTQAEDPRAFARAVEGRVLALARAHELLARDAWHGTGLRELLEQELAPYRPAGGSPPGILLEGPPMRLAPDAVQPLSMVMHELATNAAKYGALSVPGGRLRVTWRRGAEDGLLLRWEERGGPPLSGEPARRGFGSRLIGSALRGQLGGTVSFAWEREGLACEITLPASRLDAHQAEAAIPA